MKKALKVSLVVASVLAIASATVACDGSEIPENLLPTFTVTYSLGAGTGTVPTQDPVHAGETVTLASADGFICVGYTFDGWSDGTVKYNASATFTMPNHNVTFTAQWEAIGDGGSDQGGSEGEGDGQGGEDGGNGEDGDGGQGEGDDQGGSEGGDDNGDGGHEGDGSDEGDGGQGEGDDHGGEGENGNGQGGEEGNGGDEENATIYSAYELNYKGTILLYEGGTGLLDYGEDHTVNLTYTLSGTAIAITIGDSTFNGTYTVSGANKLLTIQFVYKSVLYKFGAAESPSASRPTVTFDANGGTGNAPVMSDEDITVSTNDQYDVKLPQNSYTPPDGKVFDKWEVIIADRSYGKRSAGSVFKANSGETLKLKATWVDAAAEVPTGVDYYGSCHIVVDSVIIPVDVVVTAIKFDAENEKMFYRKGSSLTYTKSRSVQNQDSDSDKPNDYGAGAKFYEVKIENYAFKLLLSADGSKIKLFEVNLSGGHYIPLENGEFFTEFAQ